MKKKALVKKINSATALKTFSQFLDTVDKTHLHAEIRRFPRTLNDYDIWQLDSADEEAEELICFERNGGGFFIKNCIENSIISFFPRPNWELLAYNQKYAFYASSKTLIRVGFIDNQTIFKKFDSPIVFEELAGSEALVVSLKKSPIRQNLLMLAFEGEVEVLDSKEIKNLEPICNKGISKLGVTTLINGSGEYSIFNWSTQTMFKTGVHKPIHFNQCFITTNSNHTKYSLFNFDKRNELKELADAKKVEFYEDKIVSLKSNNTLSIHRFDKVEGIYETRIIEEDVIDFSLVENLIIFLKSNKEIGMCMSDSHEFCGVEYFEFLNKKLDYENIFTSFNDTIYLPSKNENKNYFSEIVAPDLSTTHIELPKSRRIRSFAHLENELYFSFEGSGISRFDCLTQELAFNESINNIRSIRLINNKCFLASWDEGLVELNRSDLSIEHRFAIPESLKSMNFFKVEGWEKLLILSGYCHNKSVILIYKYNTSSIPFELTEHYGNNLNHDFIVDGEMLFFNGVDKDNNKFIKRFNLKKFEHEQPIPTKLDYRYFVKYFNKIVAISFDVEYSGFDVLMFEPVNVENVEKLTLPSKGGGLRRVLTFDFVQGYFIDCYHQTQKQEQESDEEYHFWKFDELKKEFIHHFSIEVASTGFEVVESPWNKDKDHVCLASPVEIVFVDMKKKVRIGGIKFFGKDILFELSNETYYFSTDSKLISHHLINPKSNEEELVPQNEQNEAYNDLEKVIESMFGYTSNKKTSSYLLKSLPKHI